MNARFLLAGGALLLAAYACLPAEEPSPMPDANLRLPHTSLEGCAENLEWVRLMLPNGEVWEVTADAPWRADGGLERFRPTPSWVDAKAFAESVGAQLITAELSDAAWTAADVRLRPHPLGDRSTPEASAETDRQMMGEAFALRENQLIEAERAGRTGLIATVGKDYVIDARNAPGRCTIYGWHQANGTPIQGVNSHSHEPTYRDYSHHPRIARRIG